jgi:pyruvate/2-oxoglutarate dehydrogenase complex dihydrolipoamide acyltransferase (E2) component
MRCSQRLIAAGVLVALCGLLAGCGGGGISSFDPSDMLDFLDTKKKLPGDRKDVFPEGVPGLEQGVPKELYKGAAGQQARQQQAANPVVDPAPPAPKAKAKRKAAPAAAPAAQSAAPDGGDDAAPKPTKRAQRAASPATQDPQQQSQPFPAPLPSGSFAR